MSDQKPFNADHIRTDNWDGFAKFRKHRPVVDAVQMNFPEGFEVLTPAGRAKGAPGDFLVIGREGHGFPVKKDIFQRLYELVPPSAPEP